MRIPVCLCVGLAAIVQPAASCSAFDFVAGRIYTSRDGGFVEWNTELRALRSVTVLGLGSATGVAFNSANNLVMIGRYNNQARLLEVNSDGQVLRSAAVGGTSLLRGSYVDYDAASNHYVVASERELRLLDGNFNTIATSARTFQRASGVAFGVDGRIYATDQFDGTLSIFSASLQPLSAPAIGGWIRTGMELANNGDLFLTDFGEGKIQRRNQAGVITTLVSGLGYGNLSDVDQLPDGRIVSISAGNTLTLYTENGALLASGTFGASGDGVAYFVPAPTAAVLFAIAAWPARQRRRSGGAVR